MSNTELTQVQNSVVDMLVKCAKVYADTPIEYANGRKTTRLPLHKRIKHAKGKWFPLRDILAKCSTDDTQATTADMAVAVMYINATSKAVVDCDNIALTDTELQGFFDKCLVSRRKSDNVAVEGYPDVKLNIRDLTAPTPKGTKGGIQETTPDFLM
jgi:hypothetical protein